MDTLRIALVQSELYWENPAANLAMFEETLSTSEPVDVFVLPEMFNSGFTMNVDGVSEPENYTTLRWMKLMAARHKAAITGSFIVRTSEDAFNRLYWVNPDGTFVHYNKRHLFRMAREEQHFTEGNARVIIDYKGWRIAPFVCYDLRFPVWSRNRSEEGRLIYDVAIYVANWPKARAHAWNTLLMARAMENSAYVCGVNRIGTDGNDVEYNGQSSASDPKGSFIVEPSLSEGIFVAELSMEALQAYREKFPAHLDGDDFHIKK